MRLRSPGPHCLHPVRDLGLGLQIASHQWRCVRRAFAVLWSFVRCQILGGRGVLFGIASIVHARDPLRGAAVLAATREGRLEARRASSCKVPRCGVRCVACDFRRCCGVWLMVGCSNGYFAVLAIGVVRKAMAMVGATSGDRHTRERGKYGDTEIARSPFLTPQPAPSGAPLKSVGERIY